MFGGESSEHEVSIKSAHNIFAALDSAKYDVSLCYVSKEGHWFLLESIYDNYEDKPQLLPQLGLGSFITPDSHIIIKPDVIFPALHGKFGEDGSIQGLAKMMHIPCVGPSMLGSAVTMEKDTTKRLLKEAGIPVVPWILWKTSEERPSYSSTVNHLGEVLFVKPSRAGSSIGVSKVVSSSEWDGALDIAAKEDSLVLIEQAIEARELQVAVLGNHKLTITDICGIDYGAEFHDFDDKYSEKSGATFTIPANLSSEETENIKAYAHDAYIAVGGRGMARIDFFQDKNTNQFYLNEINTIPGFTNVSVYPRLWRHAGKDYAGLIDELISLALENTV